jgi:glycogen synthase
MRGTSGKLEVDELTEETLAFLRKGSLGDLMRAYEKFKDDPSVDKEILATLHSRIKKSYSAKFKQGVAMHRMFNEEDK